MEKKKNWFKRHPIWTTIIGIFSFLFIVTLFVGDGGDNSYSSNSEGSTSEIKSASKSVGIGDKGILYSEGDDILVAVDKKAFDEMTDAAVAKDMIGYEQIFYEGRSYWVESGTKVLVLDRDWGTTKFRILEGEHQSRIGWTPYEWVIPL